MHKSPTPTRRSTRRVGYYLPFLLAFMLAVPALLLAPAAQVHAEAIPGGNVSNQVIKAVDIAKPAVVRIITTLRGRLTVHFTTDTGQQSATFPQNGGYYNIDLSGSGAFISSNGDILTADHVIHPTQDKSLDQYLQMAAAKDVAAYINANFAPDPAYTEDDAFSSLYYGVFRSEASYTAPKSEVYLSQDYTGSDNATSLSNVPATSHATVDRVEIESPATQKDVAIVHVAMTDTPSIQIGDSTGVAQQDELTIIGFPGNGDLGDQDHENPDMLLTSSVNKIYVSAIKQGPNGQPLIQVGGNVEHGDSGGPAIDSKGNVVGIVSFYSDNADTPVGTSFLQASLSAQELVNVEDIDTKPGKFELAWQHAFALYASTQAGHWHAANTAFKQLLQQYPDFQAAQAFMTYTAEQAQHEDLSAASASQSSFMVTLLIVLAIICVLFVLGVFLFMRRERKRSQAALALTTAAPPVPGPVPPFVGSVVPPLPPSQAHHYIPQTGPVTPPQQPISQLSTAQLAQEAPLIPPPPPTVATQPVTPQVAPVSSEPEVKAREQESVESSTPVNDTPVSDTIASAEVPSHDDDDERTDKHPIVVPPTSTPTTEQNNSAEIEQDSNSDSAEVKQDEVKLDSDDDAATPPVDQPLAEQEPEPDVPVATQESEEHAEVKQEPEQEDKQEPEQENKQEPEPEPQQASSDYEQKFPFSQEPQYEQDFSFPQSEATQDQDFTFSHVENKPDPEVDQEARRFMYSFTDQPSSLIKEGDDFHSWQGQQDYLAYINSHKDATPQEEKHNDDDTQEDK